MTRHDGYIGVIGFSVIAVAIELGGSSFVWADERLTGDRACTDSESFFY
jgi:hypothetical protein